MQAEIDTYLERQYNNRAAVPEHGEFLADWASRSVAFRERSDGILNLSYGPSARQCLDIFPAAQDFSAVHVFIHGGYWQALSKESFSFLAEKINRNGETAVIVNYDLCPQVTIVEIIDQLRLALHWVGKNITGFGGDPARLQVSGHSAGGHLLTCLLTEEQSKKADFCIRRMNSLSGLFDLQPLLQTSVNQALRLDAETAREASPLLVTPSSLPVMPELKLYVGELESDAYKNQSIQLAEAWSAFLPLHFEILESCHHFSIVDAFFTHHYRALVD